MHGIKKEEESAPAQEVYTSGRDSTLLARPLVSPQAGPANEDRNPVLHGTEMHEMHMETGQ